MTAESAAPLALTHADIDYLKSVFGPEIVDKKVDDGQFVVVEKVCEYGSGIPKN